MSVIRPFGSLVRALALLVALALPAAAQDEAARERDFLTRLIEDNLSDATRRVRIDGFAGALSSRATFDRLTIADAQGVWLTIEAARLDWTRSALLSRRLEVAELSAGRIVLERLPAGGGGGFEVPRLTASDIALPVLPVSIDIGRIGADVLELGPQVAGQPVTARLDGSLRLVAGEGEAQVELARIDDRAGGARIDAAFSNATRLLRLDLTAAEAQGGAVAGLLGLPGTPALDFVLGGEGPVSDFAADIRLATEGTRRVAGALRLQERPGGAQGFALDLAGDVAPLFEPDYAVFFGTQASLALAGALPAEGGTVIEALTLRTEELTLQGSAALAQDGLPIAFSLDGAIRPRRAEGALLPLPGEPVTLAGATLAARFDATAGQAWSVEADVNGLRQGVLTLANGRLAAKGEIARDGDASRVTARLQATLAGLVTGDRALDAALGQRLTASLGLAWTEGQPMSVSDVDITAGPTRLTGAGTLGGLAEGARIDGAGRIEAADLSRFAGLYGASLSGAASAELSGFYQPLGGAFDLRLDTSIRDLAAGQELPARLLNGQSRASGRLARTTDGITAERLEIRTPRLTARLDGGLTPLAGALSFDAALVDLSDILSPLPGPARLSGTLSRSDGTLVLDVTGDGGPGLAATVAGTAAPDLSTATLSVEARMTDLGSVVPALPGAAAVVGRLSLGSDGIVGRVDLGLPDGASATLSGRADTDLTFANGIVEARLADLGALVPGLDGPARAEGPVSLRNGVVSFDLTAGAQPGLTARVTGQAPDGAASASARVEVRLADLAALVPQLYGEVTASGRVAWQDRLMLDLTGTAPLGAAFAVRGSLVPGSADADLLLTGTAPLALASPFLPGVTAQGDLDFDLTLRGAPGLDAVAGTLDGQGWSLAVPQAGLALTNASARVLLAEGPGLAADVTLAASVSGPSWDRALDGPVEAAGRVELADGQVVVPALDLRNGDAAFSGSARGSAARVAAEGTLTVGLSRLGRLLGVPANGSARLAMTVAHDLGAGRTDLTVDGTTADVRLGGAPAFSVLNGAGRLAADLSLDASGLTLRRARLATAALDLRAEGPTVEARLDSLGRLVPQLPGPVTARGTVVPLPGGARIDLRVGGPGGIALATRGRLAASSDLAISGTAPLGLSNAFLSTAIDVQGTARLDLALAGPPALTSLSGTVSTAGARAVLPLAGFALGDIRAEARLSGGRADITASGTGGEGGRLTASGSLGLTPPVPLDLDLGIERIGYTRPPTLRTTLDGALRLSGAALTGGTLSGRIDLGETEVNLALAAPGGTLAEIDHVGDSPAVAETRRRAGLGAAAGAAQGSGQLSLDVLVSAPRRIFVRGRGLDAELGGELTLTGRSDAVVPLGGFRLIRGRLDLLGRRLNLTEGEMLVRGSTDPDVRLVAQTSAEDVEIAITIAGAASAPSVALTSSPDLPQDEILALMLFGKSLTSISPLQALQLAAAIRTLVGDGGQGLMGDIRRGFGLDDLDVSTDEGGNVALRAGKYIGDNAYADVTVGADGESEIQLNLDITPDLTARGTVTSDGETGLGLFFEKDY